MSVLPTGILLVFSACLLVLFLVPFFRENVAKELSWSISLQQLRAFALVVLPVAMLMVVGQHYQVVVPHSLLYFSLGSFVPFVLKRMRLPSKLIAPLLLMLIMLQLTTIDPEAAAVPIEAMLTGLLVWKLSEGLFFQGESTLEDVLLPTFFLIGLHWIDTHSLESQLVNNQGLLLGLLSIGCLMKVLQGPFLHDDKLYVKRLVLAATGGLLTLIFITKLLLVPSLERVALLFGGGMFLIYLLQDFDNVTEGDSRAANLTKQIILIGILTLVASRLYGTLGLLVLAAASLVAGRRSTAAVAGLFFSARVALESFVLQYNPNVTGINVTHAYAGAALYAGFLLAVLLSICLRDVENKGLLLSIILGITILAPLASNFLLHAEPTGSLLISTLVSSVLICILSPVLYKTQSVKQEYLMLVPLQMVVVAMLGGKLIDLGNVMVAQEKMKLLLYLVVIVLLLLLGTRWWSSRLRRQAIEVSGN